MGGRAPNPNDPIAQQPKIISPMACWIIAETVGFVGHDRVIAAAVAMAESGGGNAHATHTNSNGTTDFGLWQINSVHADLFNQYDWAVPGDNGRMAHAVWQGAGGKWTPWATYPNAANLQMNKVIADIKSNGVKNPDTDSAQPYIANISDYVAQAVGDTLNQNVPGYQQLADITKFLSKLSNPKSWASVGFILLGGILLLVLAWKMLAADAIRAGNKVLKSPVGQAIKAVA